MIKVIYNRNQPSVSIEGHAGSAEAGHDLVCASVSILAYTLSSILEGVDERQFNDLNVDLKDGEAMISCDPIEDYRLSIKLIFDTICAGFDLLAQVYPDNVNFEMKGS